MSDNHFAQNEKSAAAYLDIAANDHGAEKARLVVEAFGRIDASDVRIVEIGPGGGAALGHLAKALAGTSKSVHVTLIEAPGVLSDSLLEAAHVFNAEVGECILLHGWAQDIAAMLGEQADILTASALMHEVYSYGGAYVGLFALMRALPAVIKPYGFYAYRDVYAVDVPNSLHDNAMHCYYGQAWLRFLRMFIPHYLAEGAHPYHHFDDETVARQNSRIVPITDLETNIAVLISAPLGLFREVQRHYLTFRDHVWRSGALGFTPLLEGQWTSDWIDYRTGHKRVHFKLTADSMLLTEAARAHLAAVSEPFADHYVIDGDLFDVVTDTALIEFLAAAADERGDAAYTAIWREWLVREGRETYAYLPVGDLLTEVAVKSLEAGTGHVLLPTQPGDVTTVDRGYYNRFLSGLPTPLRDAKQLVLFQNVPVTDTATIRRGLEVVSEYTSKANLSRIHAAIHAHS